MTAQTDDTPEGLPAPDLTATLTYTEWCTVLAHLAGGVYRDVMPVIGKLMTQLGPQADAQQSQALLAVTPAASESRN